MARDDDCDGQLVRKIKTWNIICCLVSQCQCRQHSWACWMLSSGNTAASALDNQLFLRINTDRYHRDLYYYIFKTET